MSLLTKTLLRLRNVRDYRRELGLRGTLALLRQRSEGVDVFELPVRGFDTPVYCRATGSDFAVLRQVMGHQDAAVAFDRPPRLVIDAGANVGYSSLVFSRHYPTATIVGIEPDPTNCEMFRRNCVAYPRIRLLEGAVWPRKAMLAITNPDAAAFEFQVGEAPAAEPSNAVRAYTVSEVIDMHGGGRVDLLKLDIEGAERALFTQGTEDWLPRVDVLIVELHDRLVPGCSEALERLLKGIPHTREKRGEYHCARLARR